MQALWFSKMKKLIALLLSVLLVFGLASCNMFKDEDEVTDESKDEDSKDDEKNDNKVENPDDNRVDDPNQNEDEDEDDDGLDRNEDGSINLPEVPL